MGQRSSVALNDQQVALFVQRGTSAQLTILQEEFVDTETSACLPAKSFSITELEGIRALRDFLNGLQI